MESKTGVDTRSKSPGDKKETLCTKVAGQLRLAAEYQLIPLNGYRAVCQIRISPLSLPAASERPSELNATLLTAFTCPVRVRTS